MKKEHSEIRFGMVAVQKGYVKPAQVVDALEMQARENFSTGKHTPIGQILLDQGLIDLHHIDEILETLQKLRQN